jgi:MHS family alpha-ketoglutarate permease-like MFS transporter
LLLLLQRYCQQGLLSIGISISSSVAFYTFTIYLQKYTVNTAGFSRDRATLITTVGLLIFIVFQPLFSLLSDLIGRKPVMLIFGGDGTVLTLPIMQALDVTHDSGTALWLDLAGLLILGGFSSIHRLVESELFPVEIRAPGAGLPFAISAQSWGTTELVALTKGCRAGDVFLLSRQSLRGDLP